MKNLARDTFNKIYQGLVDIDVQRATWPAGLGGPGISNVANDLIN